MLVPSDRDFEMDEIEHLHELMNWPRIVLLLTDMQKQGKDANNWKLARRYRLGIHDLNAIRHWLFETKSVIRPRVKRILRAKIREIIKARDS